MSFKMLIRSSLVGGFMGVLITGQVLACDNVFVESLDSTSDPVLIGVSLNASVPQSLSFFLAPQGSRIDDLIVSPGSPSTLVLSAQVQDNAVQAQCSTSFTNTNLNGVCSGIVDPKYKLVVSMTTGSTVGDTCDNGNHIGEYKNMGLKVGIDVPEHYGKPGCHPLPPNVDWNFASKHGNNGGTSTVSSPTLSCQFLAVTSF